MDINKLIEGIQKLLEYMFGGKPPEWLLPVIAWGIAIGLLLLSINFVLKQIKNIWIELIQPAFYNPEDKRRRLRRQRFADYIESEIRRLNTQEEWNDHRFTELEAEVEAEGRFLWLGMIEFPNFFFKSHLRREKSLSLALEKSPERTLLVEGEPGSGKSVALRHVAQKMANKALRSRNLKQTIPFYINLKGIKRDPSQIIDKNFIEEYVLQVINRINDRDVEEFLEVEYQKGLQEGTWFFLFDSFDEIPDILSSTDADETIRAYAGAINDFLHSMSFCRGVLASREYKGPRFLDWPKFRILNLSSSSRRELIQKTGLPLKVQDEIRSGLALASQDFLLVASSPMFMNLLCDYMYSHESEEFPSHVYQVFEKYIWKRLSRDKDRIAARYGLTAQNLKDSSEKLAFCMNADYGLGLSPELEPLKFSLEKLALSLEDKFEVVIKALEYLKLARVEIPVGRDEQPTFTFSHRRFQEYFATSITLREPNRISANELLTNSRWRETAIVILQTKNRSDAQPILDAASLILGTIFSSQVVKWDDFKRDMNTKSDKKLSWLPESSLRSLFESPSTTRNRLQDKINSFARSVDETKRKENAVIIFKPIDWPESLLHILSVLQNGLKAKGNYLPIKIQKNVDDFLFYMFKTGTPLDKKLSVEVAGVMSDEKFEYLLVNSITSRSAWLAKAAFDQVSRMGTIPRKFVRSLRLMLIQLAEQGILFKQKEEVYVQLIRSEQTKQLADLSIILAWAPIIDTILTAINSILLFLLYQLGYFSPTVFMLLLALNLSTLPMRWSYSLLSPFEEYFEAASTPRVLQVLGFMPTALLFVWIVFENGFFQNLLSAPQTYLIIICNLWSTSLVLEAQDGKRIGRRWWLWYFAYPVLILSKIVIEIPKFFLQILFVFIFLIARMKILFEAFWKNKSVILRNYAEILPVTDGLFWLLWILVMIVSIIFDWNLGVIYGLMISVPIVFILLITIYPIWRDNRRYLRKIRQRNDIEFQEFVQILMDYSSDAVRKKIIRDARSNKIYILKKSDLDHLKNLTKYVDLRLKFPLRIGYQYLRKRDPLLLGLLFSEPLSSDHLKTKNVLWTFEQLDELCELYEYIANF